MSAIGNCPWCGGETRRRFLPIIQHQVHCTACCASGPTHYTPDEAITAWNRLATPGQGEVPTDLDALAALAREATPGPWFRPIANDTAIRSDDVDIAQTVGAYELEWERMEADAAYIAAANPAVGLALIEEIRRLRAAVARVRGE